MIDRVTDISSWMIIIRAALLPQFWPIYAVIAWTFWNWGKSEKQEKHFAEVKKQYGWK